jgi:signal transduction histidine kinase
MARKSFRPKSPHTILVVDDQEETLVSVRGLLEREGHRVLTAESADQALTIFKEHDVHLLLVDYFMPGKSGEQLVREIRVFDPFVQIILQTGYSGEKPPRMMLADLDIQGYHDKADGPEKLLLWVDVGLKAHRLISRLRERERLQGELVANVSHELRTPLNIIGGYTQLLFDGAFGALPQETRHPLHAIAAATNNLTDLVSDFLKYARMEAGVADIAEQPVSTEELVQELRRLGALLLGDKEVRFTVDLRDAPSAFVTDGTKLRTILRNLISNAVKFTATGEITLSIALEGSTLRFGVRDTGPGIRNEDLQLIFEPFRQIDGSSTRKHGGIGLGLALSHKLARLLGGDILVRSELGVGSTFALTLPAKIANGVAAPGASRVIETMADAPALRAAAGFV